MARLHAAALGVALGVGALQGTPPSALATEPPTDGRELLARVKKLMDAGLLFDPAAVAQAFPGEGPVVATNVIQTGACQPGLQTEIRTKGWTFAAWFHDRPAGRPHLAYRATGPFGHSGVFLIPPADTNLWTRTIVPILSTSAENDPPPCGSIISLGFHA